MFNVTNFAKFGIKDVRWDFLNPLRRLVKLNNSCSETFSKGKKTQYFT